MVNDPHGVIRLLGADGKPIPVKRIASFEADTILNGKHTRWTNDLPVIAREGADAVIAWSNLVGGRGDPASFLIETDGGDYVRAAGDEPLDGSNTFVIHATEIMRPDTAPDPSITDAAANMFVGRVVTPEGEPIAGALMEVRGGGGGGWFGSEVRRAHRPGGAGRAVSDRPVASRQVPGLSRFGCRHADPKGGRRAGHAG